MLTLKEIVAKGVQKIPQWKYLNFRRILFKVSLLIYMDNGGGSMDEAMKLAGMFIDSGPISVILDNKRCKPL
jgi:carboxyl-terminal processing protease